MSHYPGHLREAFCRWACEGTPPLASVEVDYEDAVWPAEKLLGRMTHCTDVMPGYACDELEIERGSTYARAAQRLLAERRRLAAAG